MKSFRFYLTYRPELPGKTAEHYTPDELEGFFREFQRRQNRIKRQRWALFACAIAALLATTEGRRWGPSVMDFAWPIVSVLVGLACVAAMAMIGFPKCPACHNELDSVLGGYCPECGEKNVEKSGLLQSPRCNTCNKALTNWGKRRNYRIHFCPICGVKLDAEGI